MADFFETLGSINPLRPDNMARTGLETVQGIREIKDLLDQGKEREASELLSRAISMLELVGDADRFNKSE